MDTNESISGDYQPYTAHSNNVQRRLSFLPCFPPKNQTSTATNHEENTLLLANVPVTMLSRSQRLLRRIDTFPRPFQYVENKNRHVPSFFKFLYRNFIYNLSQKLKVNESILDFNLIRLSEVTKQIALDHNSDQTRPMLNMAFHMHEWPIALEIFLQIDVDSFFMKTCTFRGSRPRSIRNILFHDSHVENETIEETEGLFCVDPISAKYLMLPCHNLSCMCCYQSLDISHRYERSVQFAHENGYRFINGYRVYLNCHATCKTTNFLYVLTCPCGQFDFIGSSLQSCVTFKDVLFDHRREGVRILHEFLLGEKIIQRTLNIYEREKTVDEKKADQMFLYRHLTECSHAIQLLLNRTTIYWPFIPMEMAEADREDELLERETTTTTTTTTSFSSSDQQQSNEQNEIASPYERTDQEVEWCLANLPKPPDGTRFSRLQYHKQKVFLKLGWDLLCLPPRHLDIFNMSIIFVLPEDCSQLLCHVIESLLITHAECKLNTTGHLASKPHLLSTSTASWYKNLVGRVYKS